MTATYVGIDDKEFIRVLLREMEAEQEFSLKATPDDKLWTVVVERTP